MKDIRIGKTFNVRWKLKTNGESLVAKNLTFFVKNTYEKKEHPFFISDGNTLVTQFEGEQQKYLGIYSFELILNYGLDGQSTVDGCQAFRLVAHNCQESGLDTVDLVINEGNIQVGLNGLSAYELACMQGFQGTLEEWLESLRGDNSYTREEADNRFASKQEVSAKQDKLVSGVNIKTINNQSLLGSGNINIEGGSGGSGNPNAWDTVQFAGVLEDVTPEIVGSADEATPDKVYYVKAKKIFMYFKAGESSVIGQPGKYYVAFYNQDLWNSEGKAKEKTFFVELITGNTYTFNGELLPVYSEKEWELVEFAGFTDTLAVLNSSLVKNATPDITYYSSIKGKFVFYDETEEGGGIGSGGKYYNNCQNSSIWNDAETQKPRTDVRFICQGKIYYYNGENLVLVSNTNITVDTELKPDSYNPIANKAVYDKFQSLDASIKEYIDTLIGGGERMDIVSSSGNLVVNNLFDSNLVATVYRYLNNINGEVTRWLWTRQSGTDGASVSSDALWNEEHASINSNTIHITADDVPNETVKFICDATLGDKVIRGIFGKII